MPAKRILILTNRVPFPLNDGGNLAVHAMVNGYKDAGWEVYLLSMLTSRHPVKESVLATLYKDIYQFETVAVNNDVKPIPTLLNYFFSNQPNHAARFYHAAFEERLKMTLHSFKPDAIQVESVFMATYLDTIKRHSQAVTILRLHNIEYQVWSRLAGEVSNPVKKMYLKNLAGRIRRFEERAWDAFDMLLPITKDDAAVVLSAIEDGNIVVAPFGIDADILPAAGEEQWNGYHIGAMDWLPNAEAVRWFLGKVWPQVRRAVPEFTFFFAGRNMPDSFKVDIPAGVVCAGEVADANAFIEDKKILIVPLRSGGGIRVKILEAMAAGKLVISTDIGMQGIEAMHNEHYLAANTAEDFANAIRWAVTHKDEARQIAESGKELVAEKYRQSAIIGVVIDKLERLL